MKYKISSLEVEPIENFVAVSYPGAALYLHKDQVDTLIKALEVCKGIIDLEGHEI
jgi:hypothetical protein